MNFYKISIDPGTNHTGYCVWFNGEPVALGTINTIRKGVTSFQDKLHHIKTELDKICDGLCFSGEAPMPIEEIAIEEFAGGFHEKSSGYGVKASLASMTKCACVQGFIYGLCHGWADKVELVNKGTVSKADTKIRARVAGLIKDGEKGPSKDALDAYEIGVAAGFDRRG